MARHVILLEAQQAGAPFTRQLLGLRQLDQRSVRSHVLAKYRLHPLGMARTHRVASRLRRAKALQVHIGDAMLVQTRRELAFREARACAIGALRARRSVT